MPRPRVTVQPVRRCSKCGEEKPATDFYKSPNRRDGLYPSCKACVLAARATPEAKAKKAAARNPETARAGHLRRTYGITPEDYKAILDAQGGVCAVCSVPPTDKRRLVLDHNHKTGEVRGLIHNWENYLLGIMRDNAELAENLAQYLRNPPARSVLGPDHRTPLKKKRTRKKAA